MKNKAPVKQEPKIGLVDTPTDKPVYRQPVSRPKPVQPKPVAKKTANKTTLKRNQMEINFGDTAQAEENSMPNIQIDPENKQAKQNLLLLQSF